MLRKFSQSLVNFLKNDDGPTAVEYAVMVALIIVVLIVVIQAMTNSVSQTFSNTKSALDGANGS